MAGNTKKTATGKSTTSKRKGTADANSAQEAAGGAPVTEAQSTVAKKAKPSADASSEGGSSASAFTFSFGKMAKPESQTEAIALSDDSEDESGLGRRNVEVDRCEVVSFQFQENEYVYSFYNFNQKVPTPVMLVFYGSRRTITQDLKKEYERSGQKNLPVARQMPSWVQNYRNQLKTNGPMEEVCFKIKNTHVPPHLERIIKQRSPEKYGANESIPCKKEKVAKSHNGGARVEHYFAYGTKEAHTKMRADLDAVDLGQQKIEYVEVDKSLHSLLPDDRLLYYLEDLCRRVGGRPTDDEQWAQFLKQLDLPSNKPLKGRWVDHDTTLVAQFGDRYAIKMHNSDCCVYTRTA